MPITASDPRSGAGLAPGFPPTDWDIQCSKVRLRTGLSPIAMPVVSRSALRRLRGGSPCGPRALLEAFRFEMAVDYKADLHDIVTVHDRRAEAIIRAYIFEH